MRIELFVRRLAALPGNPEDQHARYIEAAVQGVLVTSIYLPNGNPQSGPKFNYKLAWFERLNAHAAELMASGAPVVLAGDYYFPGSEKDYTCDPDHSGYDKQAIARGEVQAPPEFVQDTKWADFLQTYLNSHPGGPVDK